MYLTAPYTGIKGNKTTETISKSFAKHNELNLEFTGFYTDTINK